MRYLEETFWQSKLVVCCGAIIAFALFGVGVAIAFGQGGIPKPHESKTQPDTRPTTLTVIPGGKGVGSTEAAAALQSQSPQSPQLAAPALGSSLMGQTSTNLQAGMGGLGGNATGSPTATP